MSGRTFLLLLVLILIIHATLEYGNWRRDRRKSILRNYIRYTNLEQQDLLQNAVKEKFFKIQ